MSMNNAPSGERLHIGIFGRRNAGKSSLINALTGQSLAIVSDVKGTTTDPVIKAMELLPLGPVVVIDTPGLDDEGELGEKRIKKAYQMLNKTEIAILVVDGTVGMIAEDEAILQRIVGKGLPYIIVFNHADEMNEDQKLACRESVAGHKMFFVSATTKQGINELKEEIGKMLPSDDDKCMVRDLIKPSDLIILVVPIDKAAPKGRLILPQQMAIRDILDGNATALVVKEDELENTLATIGKKPFMVITDSQVFELVDRITPKDIYLTSFSILMARYRGDLETTITGARALDKLKNGDTVLIAEACTHHRQCGDIGTQKLPNWINKHSGKKINYEFCSGTEFPDDLSKYNLIVHCGACMINPKEMQFRLKCAVDAGVPITNYGIAIAHMHGILDRSLQIFGL